jgi:hypothetical protein
MSSEKSTEQLLKHQDFSIPVEVATILETEHSTLEHTRRGNT